MILHTEDSSEVMMESLLVVSRTGHGFKELQNLC